MRTFIRFMMAFLVLTAAVVLATGVFGVQFGRENYWDHHGFLFLVFVTFFPRLTLLLSGVATGGLLWWLGWIFSPHLLVAVLATQAYWYQNPFLVVVSWLVAMGGESSEKFVVVQRSRRSRSGGGWGRGPGGGRGRGYDSAKWVDADVKDPS